MTFVGKKVGIGALVFLLILSLFVNLLIISPLRSYAAGELTVHYRTGDTNAMDNQLKPQFSILNNSTAVVALNDLKLRYYYTVDGEVLQQFHCDWAEIGCANVSGSFGKLTTPVTGADSYLEVSFGNGAGYLAPGAQTGDIQIRINKSNWSNYNEADDYSYIGSQVSYAVNNQITLYQDGILIAGAAPGGNEGSNPTPVVPPAPSSVTAIAGNAQVTLSWAASNGATSYTVKRAVTTGGPYSNVATSVTGTSYTNDGLINGTTYYYVISAVSSLGESLNSAQVSATPSVSTVPTTITGDTTIAALCPKFKEIYLDRTFLDYLPGDGSGGHGGHAGSTWMSDADKAELFQMNISAVSNKIGSGTLTFNELGTQALGHVQRLDALGFPRDGLCKLLPRLALLGLETEDATFHKSTSNPWPETSAIVEASNHPPRFIQQRWPSDARTYQPAEKAERDRIHDQPVHENNVGWTFTGAVGPEILYDTTNPVLNAVRNKVHPVTGLPLGGDSFTSNAPMSATAKMHTENEGFWYQVLQFKNTSDVPYFLDGAVIWWVGPSGLAYDLRNGHYNNTQRPGPGYGHPQRDIIEVVYDQEQLLSVYVIRLAFHDEPYNMRTAYPNQYWSLEVGTPAHVNGQARFTTSEERQEMLDLMVNTLHVELESNMDRNIDLLNALKLRNRVSN